LVKSGLAPKYIEEIIPTDNFNKVLKALENPNSPESIFIIRFIYSILITNIITILFIIIIFIFFVRKTISPINIATEKIKNLNTNLN
jgi:hypothetical protein